MKFLENILKKFLSWPGGEPIGLNSSVWIIDEDLKYLPIISQVARPSTDMLTNIKIYTGIWIFIIILFLYLFPFLNKKYKHLERFNILKEKWYAFLLGYIIGFIILLIQTIISKMNNYLAIVNDPKPQLKLINVPVVNNYKSTDKNLKNNIDSNNAGDFKILVKNNIFPKSDRYGYLITADTYLNYEKENKIKGIYLNKYLDKDACTNCKGYNPDTHTLSISFNDRLEILSSLAFYLGTLMLTFGLYISYIHEIKIIKNSKILFLAICIVLLITLIVGIIDFTIPGDKTISNYNNLIGYKQNLTILAISFAITAILLV